MIKLDDDMKQAINNAFTDGVPIVWATAGADGQPSGCGRRIAAS
jgi:hypothetical protein